MTQEEFARRLMVSRNYVSQIESGKKKPALRLIQQMKDLAFSPAHSGTLTQSTAREVVEMTYGAAGDLRRKIADDFNRLLDAAGSDVVKLGWIATQLAMHLRPPAHWSPMDEDDRQRAIDAARSRMPPLSAPGGTTQAKASKTGA